MRKSLTDVARMAAGAFPLHQYRNYSAKFLETTQRIQSINPSNFTFQDFTKELKTLCQEAENYQKNNGKRARYTMLSDTGSVMSHEVMAKKFYNNAIISVLGPDPELIENEKDAVKTLFINDEAITRQEKLEAMEKITVNYTSSSTQANKVVITCIGNVNRNNGEIALASNHSHIFAFEVDQPAGKVYPEDKVTGKLTVKDLIAADLHYSKMGKRTKVIHLDQPTKGDHFYNEAEITAITEWAHSKKILVTMDVERLANYLPIANYDSYYKLTAGCGIDAITLGMQKNGGARSSAAIILDRTYIDNAHNVDQRIAAFIKTLGDVSDNKTFIASGWSEMIKDKKYQTNASRANHNAEKIARAISDLNFDPTQESVVNNNGEVTFQNYPLTTNMMFTKLPKMFVGIFNKAAALNGDSGKLSTDRYGTTRIVTSYDVPEEEIDHYIHCLKDTHNIYRNTLQYSNLQDLELLPRDKITEPPPPDISDSELTINESKEALQLLMKKAEESILANSKGNKINWKFTHPERPLDSRVLARMFENNSIGYRRPYGDDDVTKESAEMLRNVFNTKAILGPPPVVLTSSKAQSTTCVMQFLKATNQSRILVAEGSFSEHYRYGRPVKMLELTGEYKKTDKLDPKGVTSLLSFHNSNHGKHVPLLTGIMIEQPTSKGELYTPDEIKEISVAAKQFNVPVVLQTSAFTYGLARNNKTYKEYSTDCIVDICAISFQGVGGGPSSAIVVLNPICLPYHDNNSTYLDVMLNRTVKENGGRLSDSATLATGWKEMLENDTWRENAQKVNRNVSKIVQEFKKYQLDNKPIEFENDNPSHNLIAIKLPEKFVKSLNEKGYEFNIDAQGYVRCQVPYNLRDEEVDKFFNDFKLTHEEYKNKPSPSAQKPTSNNLSKTNQQSVATI